MIARMKRFLLTLLSCLLLLTTLACHAASNTALHNLVEVPASSLTDTGAISIKGASDFGLSAEVSALTDERGKETIASVAGMDSSRFTPLKHIFSAGYTRKVYWLRIVLRHNEKTPERWLLEVGPGYLDDVRLYTADATTITGFREHKSGDVLPFAARELPHRLMVFPISLSPVHASDTVYLRLQSTSTIMAHMALWQPRDFAVATQMEYLGLGLVLGVLLLMLLFSTVFWFLLRERYLLLFVGLIVSMLIAVLGINGLSEQVLFPSHPALANLFAPVGFCLLVFFSIWFFIDFLKVRQQYPRLYWIFVADMTMAVLGLCGLVFDFYVEVAPVIVGCSLFIIPLCTFIAWRSSEFGIFGSRWVAVGYSSYYLLISLNLFEALGLIPGHNFIVYGWQYGATLYVVFLVSGVLTRIREMERSRDLALAMSAAAEAKAEIANAKHREKNTFLNLMAHELKTPLASIDAATQVLAYMAQQAPDSAVARRHDRIRAAVARLNTLVEDSLNMAKGNVELTQEQSLRRKNCDMDEFLKSIREGYVSEKSLKISADGVGEFYGDQAQLRLAIHNLLDNAVKYGCCDEAIILTVKRLGIGDQPGIEFSVSSGITKTMDEDCELWFNKGWRGKHAVEIDGMGLGLPLVREIAELHGGIAYCRLEDGNPQFADRYFVVAIWIPVRGLNGEGR